MFQDVIDRLRRERTLVLVHGNADPDAFGSAMALRLAFPNVEICAPGGLDRVSKVISRKFGYEPLSVTDISVYELVMVLDTSSPEQLVPYNQPQANWVVIDHHARTDRWEGTRYFCDESRRSCAEIVSDLLIEAEVPITKDVGMALLSGMVTDSGHFRYASHSLLRSFAEVMARSGVQMDEVLDLIDLELDISERIAVLRGAQRLRFERVGENIVAISLGSSFESSVCRSLLAMGADVAFVVSQRDEMFRLSARARPELVRSGLHLGKMLEDVGKETMNEGGGHPGAAGLTGIGDAEAIANMCMSRTMQFLRTLKAERST